jgi:hypothetical protein
MTCTHRDGDGFNPLPPPLEGTYKCEDCGALAYRRFRPSHRGARRGALRMYKCRVKGCTNAVIERRFGKGWNLVNGCSEHPAER